MTVALAGIEIEIQFQDIHATLPKEPQGVLCDESSHFTFGHAGFARHSLDAPTFFLQ
jgi:hypothetical protein